MHHDTNYLGIIIGFVIYFIPTVVASLRRHRSVMAIAFLNVLAGWTFVGWILAMIWSLENS